MKTIYNLQIKHKPPPVWHDTTYSCFNNIKDVHVNIRQYKPKLKGRVVFSGFSEGICVSVFVFPALRLCVNHWHDAWHLDRSWTAGTGEHRTISVNTRPQIHHSTPTTHWYWVEVPAVCAKSQRNAFADDLENPPINTKYNSLTNRAETNYSRTVKLKCYARSVLIQQHLCGEIIRAALGKISKDKEL